MKVFTVLSAILLVGSTANAAPVSDPQHVVNVVRTSTGSLAPLTQVRVVPVDTRQFSHLTHEVAAHPTHSIQTLRTIPTHSVQEVRTIPGSHSAHHSHSVQEVRTVPTQTVVQRTVPTETVVHRTVPTQTVVHTAPVPVRAAVVEQPSDAVAQYSFGYSIADTKTGDSKTRQETRNGDLTTGSYSVADPDGRIRTVTYTADAVHGFQAQVTYDGEEGPPAIAINAPETTEFVSSSSPSIISVSRDDAAVEGARIAAVAQPASLFDNAVPVSTPVTNIQAVRTVPTVVRSDAAHVVHTAPLSNVQTLRTVPRVVTSDAAHVVHTAPIQRIHAAPQTVRAVTSPAASHIIHHSDHSTPTASILRSVSPNVLHFQSPTGLRSVPVIGVGQNQFLRAVNTAPFTTAHLVHA